MNGPLNYYRTAKFRHDEEKGECYILLITYILQFPSGAKLGANLRPDLAVLFLWGTLDRTVLPSVIAKSHKFIQRLQEVSFEGKGHWLMIEAANEVTDKIAEWLNQLSIIQCNKLPSKL
jgi:soluble epoxide hydrolase / lipid-phosphate phosphatase